MSARYKSETSLPQQVRLIEVGPREGFQFEGIGDPHRISTDDKLRLIEGLANTGLSEIQVASFVSPRAMPQMGDAEELCAGLPQRDDVRWSGIYLNEAGLRRAIATERLAISGELTLSASEAFALRNQRRDLQGDTEAQVKMAAVYCDHGISVTQANIMAAFGCNYEGEITVNRVIERLGNAARIASDFGGRLERIMLADTMGHADPGSVGRLVEAVRGEWPDAIVRLHLHDTRGLAIVNAYAGLIAGVSEFEAAVGGLGGCPFAGHLGAAGNIATEELVMLCDRLEIKTGVSIEALIDAARLAEEIVGHDLPSKLA